MRRQAWVRHVWQHGLPPGSHPATPATRRRLSHAAARLFSSIAPHLQPSPPTTTSLPAASLATPSLRGKAVYHVLGVETTCDDTALAILNNRGDVLASVCASQWHLLRQYQGIHPGMAAREHEKNLDTLFSHVLQLSGLPASSIDVVSVAAGPGLGPCLAVGLSWASSLARRLSSAYVGVHHLLSHVLVTQLSHPHLSFPFLALVVSGGHTETWLLLSPTHCLVLGETLDDAIGEAFDKATRLLHIDRGDEEAPGAALERTAKEAARWPVPPSVAALPPLPLPLSAVPGCDFSFSGLKTALASRVAALSRASPTGQLTAAETAHLAAAFQTRCCSHAVQRVGRAAAVVCEQRPEVRQLVMAGGVACNGQLREAMAAAMGERGLEVCYPPPALCGDNGVMIAWMGAVQASMGRSDSLELSYQPQWPAGRRIHLTLDTTL